MSRLSVKGRAEEALRHELQPGEYFLGGAAATSGPSPWPAVAVGAAGLALFAAILANVTLPPWLLPSLTPLLWLCPLFIPRLMYVAVTDRRLLCCRLSRLRGTARRMVFAVPLADVHVISYRSRRRWTAMRCEVPGHERIRLDVRGAWVKDFARVDEVLARSGAYEVLDPPWPSMADS